MVQGFTAATGLRLPSEAEWEFACRGGTVTAFNNDSNDDALLGEIAWYGSNSDGQTRPVGLKPANALGLHDMHGNVFEWVADWYASDYYASSPSVNPTGPSDGTVRVLRGGSWQSISRWARSSARNNSAPDTVSDRFGFRVARNP